MPVLRKATQEEIQEHLGLVFYVKRKLSVYLRDTRMDYDELLSAGTEGLVFAIEHFDPDKGFKFSSYATMCIKGFIFRGMRALSKEIWRERDKGNEVSNVSMTALGGDGWEAAVSPAQMEHDIDVRLKIELLLSNVPPRTREVVEYTLAHPELTHRDIGEHFGISRSTVGLAWTRTIQAGKKLWRVEEEEYQKAA